MSDHDGLGKVPNIPAINQQILAVKGTGCSVGEVSDGYHTFDELYDHRCVLWLIVTNSEIAFTRTTSNTNSIWKSKIHADGTMFDDMFILGMTFRNYVGEKLYDVSYHLPMKFWDKSMAFELDNAPEFSGYTPADVLHRLIDFFLNM